MAQEQPPENTDAGGMIAAARQFAAAGIRWLLARLRLISAEGKDAGTRTLKLLLLIAGLLLAGAFGWLFVCVAVVWLLGSAFGGGAGFAWAALIVAALHFATAAVLGMALKKRTSEPLFPITMEELKKDQAWLEQQKEKP